MNFTITDIAAAKIEMLILENVVDKFLRIYIEGGGCAGFVFKFAFANEPGDDDTIIHHKHIAVIVDGITAQYLDGATLDYFEEVMGSSFNISNPNLVTKCGCGASFKA